MNTNTLKKFAQETRKKLLKRVGERLDYVLNTDTPELREQEKQIEALRKELKHSGKQEVIDKVAYTWFNRLVALRYMDVNDYQPFHVRVISPQDDFTEPQLLSDAKQGLIPQELKVDRSRINQLLDGTLDSQNPQNEVFGLLLVAACNNLHTIFPFLFEPIEDYSELLLPVDLTSEHSVIHDVVEGMTAEDCQEVEILGWLYQFYISEKKDEVFASKGKVKKEEIPAATQLFTPRWIVEYMVQNTVGKLWVLNHPNSKLKEQMHYYIESDVTADDVLTIGKPEELTLLDQACGSGHILVYGFELLYKIYEEEGYAPSDIPKLIIEHNLHGFEIDERAAQLAGLAVLMKAREYQRRLFRKAEVPVPNITCFEDLNLTDEEIKSTLKLAGVEQTDELLHDLQHMQQATNLGSLIAPHASVEEIQQAKDVCKLAMNLADLFEKEKFDKMIIALGSLHDLSAMFTCTVANPPYMGNSNMNEMLSNYLKNNYPKSKSDLMTCFMESCFRMLKQNGFCSMVNMHSWMFLKSYEELRKFILDNYRIDSILHLGMEAFDGIIGKVVQTAAWVISKNYISENKFVAIRLVEYYDKRRWEKKDNFFNPKHRYKSLQKDFGKIPGSPIGYWVKKKAIEIFKEFELVGEVAKPKTGMTTSDNNRFVRYWVESELNEIGRSFKSKKEAKESGLKWYPYSKGGGYRKWFGLNQYLINWKNDGYELRNLTNDSGKKLASLRSQQFYFKSGISWSSVTSSKFSCRYIPDGFLFDSGGSTIFIDDDIKTKKILGVLDSKILDTYMSLFNSTLNFQPGDIARIPIPNQVGTESLNLVQFCIDISKIDWDKTEYSWDFRKDELIRFTKEGGIETLEEAYDLYQQYWTNKFFQLHQNEEELNKQFIEIYGLQEELTPDVPLNEITILQDELESKQLKKLDVEFRKQETGLPKPVLPFKDKEVFAQFVSYAVGCMFGRYSLDKEGLILANQGETLEDYLSKIEKIESEVSFLPDEDNIIPILDDNWFEDDITGLFYQFLRASFGEQNFERNLAFIEDKLGYDLRTWFSKHFYSDHVKRYKKRPIYWQFSSKTGVFKALIYMHRYTPDTLNHMLNGYLRDFKSKLNYQVSHLKEVVTAAKDAREVNKAEKELRKVEAMILELEEYERELMDIATLRINIDLDDGVLVNYNKFGQVIEKVSGLNDPKKKKSVKEFDWIDGSEIR